MKTLFRYVFQAADFEWRFNENGERVRVSVRTGYQLPVPMVSLETVDFKVYKYFKSLPKDSKF